MGFTFFKTTEIILDYKVLSDIRKILGDAEYAPNTPAELCNRLLVTCYMGTDNSSAETKHRANALSAQIGRLVRANYHKIEKYNIIQL